MDWKTFFSSIINSLAWPGTVLALAIIFKRDLIRLFFRLKRFRHNDTEVEFGAEMRRLEEEAGLGNKTEELDKETTETIQSLIRLAEISPRSAITEAYRILEVAMSKAVTRVYPGIPIGNVGGYQLHKLISNKEILPNFTYQFNKLHKLRNAAVHSEDFYLEDMPVRAYIDLALSLASKLNSLRNV